MFIWFSPDVLIQIYTFCCPFWLNHVTWKCVFSPSFTPALRGEQRGVKWTCIYHNTGSKGKYSSQIFNIFKSSNFSETLLLSISFPLYFMLSVFSCYMKDAYVSAEMFWKGKNLRQRGEKLEGRSGGRYRRIGIVFRQTKANYLISEF